MTTAAQCRCRRYSRLASACALLLAVVIHAGVCGAAPAPYPAHPIRLLVPFAAGSGGDFLARLVGGQLAADFGQPVVVENRPGAAGNVAMELAARAAPDGYTLVLGNSGTNTVNPSTYRNPGFDALGSFAPVTMLTSVPSVIVAGPSSPVRTLDELVAHARRAPAKLDYATVGVGLTSHLAMAAFARRAGIELTHIPYGTGGVLKGVLGGDVPLACAAIAVVDENIRGGRLHALAVTSARRSPSLPNVPTIAELGYPGFEMVSWYGILAPAGTPPEIVARLHAALVRIVRDPAIARRIADAGQEVVGNSPEQFAAALRTDLERGRRLVEALQIAVQ